VKAVRLAYLLIALPAVIVGIGYLVVFHVEGMTVNPAPFLGAVGALVAALLLVRHYQRRSLGRRKARR
jgi:hypothetical protein